MRGDGSLGAWESPVCMGYREVLLSVDTMERREVSESLQWIGLCLRLFLLMVSGCVCVFVSL